MNEEVKRFFDSIGFSGEGFLNSTIEKVVLKKDTKSFIVYIKNKEVIPVSNVNQLFLCASNGINGTKKCEVRLLYDEVSFEDIKSYLDYFIDEVIIRRPSLIGLKKTDIDIVGDTLYFHVLNEFEKNDLLFESKDLINQLKRYGLGDLKIEITISEDLRHQVQEEIEQDRASTVVKKEESPIVIGAHKEGNVVQLNNILGETRNVIVEVYIFQKEVVERQGKKGPIFILNMKVSDKTDSYLMKLVRFDEEEFAEINKKLNVGDWYRVHGNIEMDTYLKQMILNAKNIEAIPSKDIKVKDEASEKRVELHAHTMMSMMDGVIDAGTLVKFASKLGHKAICIMDHNCLQAYPDVYNTLAKINKGKEDKDKFKALYGAELNVVDVEANIVFKNKEYNLFDQEYVVYDTETTGLNSGTDQMIEIGAVKVKNDEIIDRFDELIACPTPLPKIITELTNITDEMLEGKDSEENVTKRFLEFIGDLPLVAHNAQFDISFVTSAVKKYNLKEFNNTVIDTMGMARNMYPEWRNHKLSTLVKNLEVEWDEDKHHRADYDCEGTSKCFYKMLYELKRQNIKTTIDLEGLADKENAIKFARPFHLTVIAKNKVGLKNLFKIISLANTKYLYKGKEPKIPRTDLMDLREGLIIGSGCINGEVFERGIGLSEDELVDMMNFYDYIEVNPATACSHIIGPDKKFHSILEYNGYITRLIKTAKKIGKLPVATGDVHNLRPDDLIYRKIIINQKANGKIHPLNRSDIEVPNMYFMTTEEMLEQFSSLDPELQKEIVITNPNKIAEMVEELQIIHDKLYTPILENSAEETKNMVYKKAHEIYGDPLPQNIEERLEAELAGIIGGGFDVIYLIAEKLVKKSNADGYFVGSRGSVGSSLVATMMGITEVNGLPPHYVCPKCKKSYFEDEAGEPLANLYSSGYDMPDRTCECGEKLKKEGQDIPFATFLGFKAEKVPDIGR